MNSFIGTWILIAIMAASLSTGDGAILAMGTVFSHNILRKVGGRFDSDENLLTVARISTLFWTLVAATIASTKPDQTA